MSFDRNHEEVVRALQEQLRCARTITPELMAEVIARACPRLRAQQAQKQESFV